MCGRTCDSKVVQVRRTETEHPKTVAFFNEQQKAVGLIVTSKRLSFAGLIARP